MSPRTRFRFSSAWLPEGWKNDVVITIDAEGDITQISSDDRVTPAVDVTGAAIPGMPNVHSHAFQRAMAGFAERRLSGRDSFWTWRETMYELARRMTPELLNVIAAQLYVEMLKAGYTTVCEFHYLHNQPDGTAFSESDAMSQALLDAASTAGIAMTLLPTLYMTSDFGSAAPTQRQRQFVMTTERYVEQFDRLSRTMQDSKQVNLGMALHSLRAVPPDALHALLHALSAREQCVIHIHVAEQEREVAESLRHAGTRPVEWLLQNAPVDPRWCLVHATHTTPTELAAIARCGAVVGLCPTTEANLGDGVFLLADYLAANGAVAIGSDSHISIAPTEELRWLEYQARLLQRQRNIFVDEASGSSGERLWRMACLGGAQACGRPVGSLQAGHRADLIVLDTASPALVGRTGHAIVDSFIFSGQPTPVRDVMVGGRWLVQDGQHFAEVPVASRYRRALQKLSLD
jgi:formimidoylglutamate deiminase